MGFLKKSPWVLHYDGSSCNGCDIEVLAALMPKYDVERFGIINTGNPKHADIFLITGAVNTQNADVIKNIYNQMGEPKVVVAVGICACTGNFFSECYNILGGVDKVIPVDVYAPGCAARPEVIIDAAGKIRVYLNSPPVDGKANSECISILSKKLKIAKSNIEIEKGDHGRNKRISVNGMNLSEVMSKINGEK